MDIEHGAVVTALQEEFPAFHIMLEHTLTGPRFIVRSRHLNQNPHTLITRDPDELRAVLHAAQRQEHPIPHQRPAVPGTLPRRRPA